MSYQGMKEQPVETPEARQIRVAVSLSETLVRDAMDGHREPLAALVGNDVLNRAEALVRADDEQNDE